MNDLRAFKNSAERVSDACNRVLRKTLFLNDYFENLKRSFVTELAQLTGVSCEFAMKEHDSMRDMAEKAAYEAKKKQKKTVFDPANPIHQKIELATHTWYCYNANMTVGSIADCTEHVLIKSYKELFEDLEGAQRFYKKFRGKEDTYIDPINDDGDFPDRDVAAVVKDAVSIILDDMGAFLKD